MYMSRYVYYVIQSEEVMEPDAAWGGFKVLRTSMNWDYNQQMAHTCVSFRIPHTWSFKDIMRIMCNSNMLLIIFQPKQPLTFIFPHLEIFTIKPDLIKQDAFHFAEQL